MGSQKSETAVAAWLGLEPTWLKQTEAIAPDRFKLVRSRRAQAVLRAWYPRLSTPDGIWRELKQYFSTIKLCGNSEMSREDRAALEQLWTSYADDNALLATLTGLSLSDCRVAAPALVKTP